MRFLRVILLVVIAGLGFFQIQGCTSTATHRSTGEAVDDATITARVKTALLADKGVSGTAVKVDTYRGVVQLSGFVDNEAQAARAAELAAKVGGVQSVKNDIRIKPQS